MILMCGLTVSAWAQTVPDAPTALVLNPGDRQIEVEWSAPADAGGSALTDYNVRYRPGSSGGWSDPGFTGTGTSTTITGLTNDRSYQVQVQAVNEQGPGAWSASVSATPATVPAAMVAPTLTPGDGRLLVSWRKPGSDGGSPLTDYNIRYRPGTGGPWTQLSFVDNVTGIRLLGLTNGQSYQVQVQAVNAQGPGAWSASASATPVDRLNAPFNPTLTPGDRQIKVTWTSPASGPTTTTITGYHIWYRSSGTTSWVKKTLPSYVNGFILTGLTNGQSYEVRVRAEDARGPGAWSPSVTATAGTVPDGAEWVKQVARPSRRRRILHSKFHFKSRQRPELRGKVNARGPGGHQPTVRRRIGLSITGYKIRYSQGAMRAAWAAHSGTDGSPWHRAPGRTAPQP